jgi:arabinogalactan oligomer/maltooligosaccharide transport system permease protein
VKTVHLILGNSASVIGAGLGVSAAVALFLILIRQIAVRRNQPDATMTAFAILPVLALGITIGFPLFYTVILSFGNMDLFHFHDPDFSIGNFIGHIVEIFTRPILRNDGLGIIFLRTLIWMLLQTGLQFLLGLVLALALSAPIRGKRMFQTILILPCAIPGTISLMTLRYEFHPTFGFVNLLLSRVFPALGGIPWWSDGLWNFISMNIVGLWLGIPFMLVMILGALRGVDPNCLEAARIDGAGRARMLISITLPLIAPTIVPAMMFSAIYKFNEFGVPFFMNPQGLESSQLLLCLALVNVGILFLMVMLVLRFRGMHREILR